MREFTDLTPAEQQTAFGCIAYWHGTKSTNSIYVLNCANAGEALEKAFDYFMSLKKVMHPHLNLIAVQPQGMNIYRSIAPILTRMYGINANNLNYPIVAAVKESKAYYILFIHAAGNKTQIETDNYFKEISYFYDHATAIKMLVYKNTHNGNRLKKICDFEKEINL